MHKLVISLASVLASTLAMTALLAQQPATPPLKTFASSAEVNAMIAKAKDQRKEGQAMVAQPILQLAPYNASLEYRAAVGPAAIHEKEAEMFFVIEGSGTIVTGGKLVNGSRTNAENQTGSAIEGGTSRTIGKGDFVIVPENTAHWFSAINGTLVLMSLHVPRPLPAAR